MKEVEIKLVDKWLEYNSAAEKRFIKLLAGLSKRFWSTWRIIFPSSSVFFIKALNAFLRPVPPRRLPPTLFDWFNFAVYTSQSSHLCDTFLFNSNFFLLCSAWHLFGKPHCTLSRDLNAMTFVMRKRGCSKRFIRRKCKDRRITLEWVTFSKSKNSFLHRDIHSIPPNKNPPAAKCFSEKSTNCEVPFPKIHQLLRIHTAVGGFLDQALCGWWIFRISTSLLVDFH